MWRSGFKSVLPNDTYTASPPPPHQGGIAFSRCRLVSGSPILFQRAMFKAKREINTRQVIKLNERVLMAIENGSKTMMGRCKGKAKANLFEITFIYNVPSVLSSQRGDGKNKTSTIPTVSEIWDEIKSCTSIRLCSLCLNVLYTWKDEMDRWMDRWMGELEPDHLYRGVRSITVSLPIPMVIFNWNVAPWIIMSFKN